MNFYFSPLINRDIGRRESQVTGRRLGLLGDTLAESGETGTLMVSPYTFTLDFWWLFFFSIYI